MAEANVDRLNASKFPHAFEHVKYENAGHTLNEFFMIGRQEKGTKSPGRFLAEYPRFLIRQLSEGVADVTCSQ